MSKLILAGAGACGRETLEYLRSTGIEPMAFVDNDPAKWGTTRDGLPVLSVDHAARKHADAKFIVTIYQRSAKTVREQLRSLGLMVEPLGTHIPVHSDLIKWKTKDALFAIVGEQKSRDVLRDQCAFRECRLDLDTQMTPDALDEIYFPGFITAKSDEFYVDCGAADGDTVERFIANRNGAYAHIMAWEPDKQNYIKLVNKHFKDCAVVPCAVSDQDGPVGFAALGTVASHVGKNGGNTFAQAMRLDSVQWSSLPTYIKMDIEGSEMEALWGGREIIRRSNPVLAVAAYHKPSDLWEIPLLIHMIWPEYDLRLRRYAEGASELVWYAIPKWRVVE